VYASTLGVILSCRVGQLVVSVRHLSYRMKKYLFSIMRVVDVSVRPSCEALQLEVTTKGWAGIGWPRLCVVLAVYGQRDTTERFSVSVHFGWMSYLAMGERRRA